MNLFTLFRTSIKQCIDNVLHVYIAVVDVDTDSKVPNKDKN